MHRRRPAPHPAPARAPLPRRGRPTRSTTRSPAASRRATSGGRCPSVSVGNAADSCPQLLELDFPADIVTDQTSAHDPLSYMPADLTPEAPASSRAPIPPSSSAARGESMAVHCAAMVGFPDRGQRGVRLRQQPAHRGASSAGSSGPSTIPGFLPAYIRPLFCEGKGPFRWVALSGDPADIAATDRAVLDEFPDDEHLASLDQRWQASGSHSRACRPGSAGSATASGTGSDCGSTTWCAAARCRRRS